MQDMKEQQKKMADYISSLLKESFGKAPDDVSVTFNGTFFTIYLRNFLSPSEKALLGA